jgi:hypothetical protein
MESEMNMAATSTVINDMRNQGLELLGEIITWNLPDNTVVSYQDLLTALRVSGLNEKVAREMLPRHAFSRAAKHLAEARIIRCTEDKAGEMLFQFTKEHLDKQAGLFKYDYETTLKLDKDTGVISHADSGQTTANTVGMGSIGDLVRNAQELLDKAKGERITADITRYIKVLFERQADLFPVRNAGGVYFVPQRHSAFVDQIEQFVGQLHGSVTRFPVPAGTQKGNKSVQEAVQQGLRVLVDEHLAAVNEFGTDTRPSTLEKAARRIEETKFKIEAYAEYLADQRDQLAVSLATVSLSLRQKTEQILQYRADNKKGQQELLS